MSEQAVDKLSRQERARLAAENIDKIAAQLEERKANLQAIAEGKGDEPAPVAPPDYMLEQYFNKWFQQLVPLRTCCFRCLVDSPMVFVPHGTCLFGGDPKKLRRGDRDITEEVVTAFEKTGWKMQNGKSYCPTCKGLGSV